MCQQVPCPHWDTHARLVVETISAARREANAFLRRAKECNMHGAFLSYRIYKQLSTLNSRDPRSP